LDTKRKTVNASTDISSDMGVSHRFRIAFNRDLSAGRNGYRRNDVGEPDWINQRGSAAADKDRRRHWQSPFDFTSNLSGESIEVCVLKVVPVAPCCKGAVVAASRTERDVKIDTK
jgi:hypothetical protein